MTLLSRNQFYPARKFCFHIALILCTNPLCAQTMVKGTVLDHRNMAIPFASVFITGTYEGTVSDDSGRYVFLVNLRGKATIGASCVGMEPDHREVELLGNDLQIDFHLKESYASILPVVITAGTFSAGEQGKAELLKPRDIGSTAGTPGDIQSTVEALPGTQRVGYTEGLFVRGGSGRESQYIMDGLIYPNPYYSHVPSLKQRGRLDPFLFSGTVFSAGGYSAQYGQALSSVLILNSTGLADSTVTGGGIHSYGGSVFHTHRWENVSLFGSVYYNNLQVSHSLLKQNTEWSRSPVNKELKLVLRARTGKSGMLKVYADVSGTDLGIRLVPAADTHKIPLVLKNTNYLVHGSYTHTFPDNRNTFFFGASLSHNDDQVQYGGLPLRQTEYPKEAKVVWKHSLTPDIRLLAGGDYYRTDYTGSQDTLVSKVQGNTLAMFAETEGTLKNKLAVRAGIRWEEGNLHGKAFIVPRVSVSYKVSRNSQVSFSYGIFSQLPDKLDLLYNPIGLTPEKATHFIANYQIQKDDRTIRMELYEKHYDALVTTYQPQANFDGYSGYARGFEVFLRDRSTIPNLDCWVSYSLTDSKRRTILPGAWVTPEFVSKHTVAVVTKYWIPWPGLLLSCSFHYATARQFAFLDGGGETQIRNIPEYSSLDMNISRPLILFRQPAILFVSVENITGNNKLLGYINVNGRNDPMPVNRSERRSFFMGLFFSMYND